MKKVTCVRLAGGVQREALDGKVLPGLHLGGGCIVFPRLALLLEREARALVVAALILW